VVSVLRILLTPVLVVLILAERRETSYLAAGLFVVGALTDGVDGYLARRNASVTRTGQWLDPLADKLLVCAPCVTMTALGTFPLWATVIVVVREVGIAVLRAVRGFRGQAMPASKGAKVKTLFQLAAITLYLLPLGSWADSLRLGVLIVAVLLTVLTGLDYLRSARRAGA
jgi:CDP-diacylglycerol--glycerol-3-phosphate 3-phosphatidyltransferase